METYNDVLKLLKRFGTYIHVGKRLYDMELAAIELDRLAKAGLIDRKTYATAKVVLNHAHEEELRHPLKLPQKTHSEEHSND
ncbi:YqgQ family protein [Lacticaseibacillus thailandensis]|uniref:DUF910 family protein n=1 Tax=Lacticaseibacillus thailandensis DSM 22698 = JCM 13996 TaxID=1423810 RepID=A0A0R2CE48_9LACO|nr:YqgQ family protein [Lacticaseibacillus thailandensis]KRM88276.1 hypothetical protein FD19_GL000568 [Lacticaseibacillus thailandensis DSM 22698 = JCM 13996]